MVQQEFFCVLTLLLEGRLGMNVSQYFRSSCTIETEGCKGDNALDKVLSRGIDSSLEEIDKHWIHDTDDFTIRNKQYKEEENSKYEINVGSFDIT